MATKITLRQWLACLVLRERRKQDAYTRDVNDTTNNCFLENKKATQKQYIETAVSVALLLVQSLILSPSHFSAHCITIDNFTVEIDDVGGLDLAEFEEKDLENEKLQIIIETVTRLEFTPSNDESETKTHGDIQRQQQSDDAVLREVGKILHQLLCRGVHFSQHTEGKFDEDDEDNSQEVGENKGRENQSVRKMLRKANLSSADKHLLNHGVPNNLSRMVIDLISCEDGKESTKFVTIEHIAEELIQIISKADLFLYKSERDSIGLLNFGNDMYGRRNETASFLRAAMLVTLDIMETHSKQLILVEGLPGSGKTHFVEQNVISSDLGLLYINVKFDPHSQPFSVVTSAFDRFFTDVIANRNEREYVARVISSLQRNLSSSAIVSLCDLIPSIRILFPSILRRVVSDEDLSARGMTSDYEFASGSQMSRIRLHFLYRKLIKAVCSSERPLALFFDDLQWADESCLELLSALMERYRLQELEDEDGTHCLFIGCYRSNEISDDLLLRFDSFELSPSIDVTKIQLTGLNRDDSNNMISEVLRIPARLTNSFSEIVQRKTEGNPFHIITFMHSLVNDSILTYSLPEDRWIWDIEAVKSAQIDKTVLELLSRKLSRLPDDIADALKVISCIGPKVDETIIDYLYKSLRSRTEFISCLDSAVSENILEKNEENAYIFVHDMLKQSAYALMTGEEKGQKHFWIGMNLIDITSEKGAFIFSVADQINAANSYGVTEEALHIKFAEINLKAGRMSIDASNFQSALSYLKEGVSLLNGWKDGHNYDLSLQLYQSAALVSYWNTDISLMQNYLTALFKNATCFDDKIPGHLVMIQSMLSSGKQREAMSKILSILEELGISISTDVEPREADAESATTKALLEKLSIDDVINGKKMTDKKLRWTLKFLVLLCHVFYATSNSQANRVTACKIVRLSLEHGFCGDSAVGLQAYGYTMLNFQNDVDESLKWFRASKRLVESLGAKQLIPTVTAHSSVVTYWKEPLQCKIENLKDNHRELLMVGDMDTLSFNANHFARRSLLCGRNLQTAEKECAALVYEMHQLGQMHTLLPMISNHLTILKLIGSNHEAEHQRNIPLFHLLNSEINDEDGLLNHALSNRQIGAVQHCYLDRLMSAFWSKNYIEAAQYAEKYSTCKQILHFPDLFHTFFQGISAFRLARLGGNKAREWEDIGEKALSKYQVWVNHSEWNWENKMLLLEAESFACKGEAETAVSKFHASIRSANKHRFVHEEGLASELLGMFHEENNDGEEALRQYAHSRSCYQKWGAFSLADRVLR